MKHNWEYKRLGDVCILRVGGDKPSEISEIKGTDKSIPIYSNGIDNEGLYGYCSSPTVLEPAVTISGRGTLGVPFIRREPFVPIVRLIVAIPRDMVCLEYLYYWILNRKFSGNGVAIPQLTVPMIKNEAIPVPPMEVQQQIVAELDKINEVIEDCRKLLCNLDNLAQSLFYDYFGDPVTNPKGWYLDVWSNLFDTILGKMLDKAKQDPNDKSIPYLANQNVQWGYFNLTNLNEMTFSNQEIEKFKLRIGDILICEGGESGRCAIWENAQSLILFQKAIHRARIKDRTKLNPYFIRFWLENLKKNDGLKNYIIKATIEHLTGAKLKTVKVPVPPLELQEKFAKRIEQIEEQKKAVEETIKKMQTLLDSRMDYWFND